LTIAFTLLVVFLEEEMAQINIIQPYQALLLKNIAHQLIIGNLLRSKERYRSLPLAGQLSTKAKL